MSIFVLGELFAGFKGGTREENNMLALSRFLDKQSVHVLDATRETAAIFGTLKSGLQKAGTPLPVNDIWIAAHTVETGAVLVTYDSHFSRIIGLRLWHQ